MNKLYTSIVIVALLGCGGTACMNKKKPTLRKIKKTRNVHQLLLDAKNERLATQEKKTTQQPKQQVDK